ncbi:hypothetical protein IV487_09190 [Enterococcus saccharolyticus]|uniref:Uncharacterized protein n=1 Tax=Candidatus Enterococcus willemsii TaxID=1857215 RepID=A0ABQ6YXB8_9ENTE|nr:MULTISPECIES: hypothetical protein [Enterococcus]KAF1302451.1 hypothetical protein BAU17_09370 [Enterococcus sp. CU12B]MCD5002636.1 hypothetical protein [Enterococcus saccharolyticus]
METELDWLKEQLEQLAKNSREYQHRALFLGLQQLLVEQQKRKEQLQGRLDGELWSPKKWEE